MSEVQSVLSEHSLSVSTYAYADCYYITQMVDTRAKELILFNSMEFRAPQDIVECKYYSANGHSLCCCT